MKSKDDSGQYFTFISHLYTGNSLTIKGSYISHAGK